MTSPSTKCLSYHQDLLPYIQEDRPRPSLLYLRQSLVGLARPGTKHLVSSSEVVLCVYWYAWIFIVYVKA